MIVRHEKEGLAWIDLTAPTREEVREIAEELELDLARAEDLFTPSPFPHIERGDDYVYIVLHFPALLHHQTELPAFELDLIIGKHWLISAHGEPLHVIDQFAKELEVDRMLTRSAHADGTSLASLLLGRFYFALMEELTFILGRLRKAEQAVYQGEERDMVYELSHIGRSLLRIKQDIHAHDEILAEAGLALEDVFRAEAKRFQGAFAAYRSTYSHLSAHEAALRELRETNNALLTTKQNEIMKNLTIMAFVTFPLSLMAAIFGMNTDFIPFVGLPNDFWIIISLMLGLAFLFFMFFKAKKWL